MAVLSPPFHAHIFNRSQNMGVYARCWTFANASRWHSHNVGRHAKESKGALQRKFHYPGRSCSSVYATSTLRNTTQRHYATSKDGGSNQSTRKLPHQVSLYFKGYARLLSKYCKSGHVEAAIGLLRQARPFKLSPLSNQYVMILSSLVENGYLR